MINGTPKDFFPVRRAVRKGDPLSPFLLLKVGEALLRMIKGAMSAGLFEGFRVAGNTPAINHL